MVTDRDTLIWPLVKPMDWPDKAGTNETRSLATALRNEPPPLSAVIVTMQFVLTSIAPLSTCGPDGRGKPRWSLEKRLVMKLFPAPIAGEPPTGGMVGVG